MSIRSKRTREQGVDQSLAPDYPSKDLHRSLVGLTTSVVRSCVRYPDLVNVSYSSRQNRMTIELASKDRGILIGKGGRTLRALEDVLLLSQYYMSGSSEERMSLPLIELTTARRDRSD